MALNLPTPEDMYRARRGQPLLKGKSRLELKAEAKPLTTVTERAFKKEVWTRDRNRCRWCKRKVRKTIERIPERGEVHHLHGRLGDLAYESKCAILVCLEHHEKLTGRVNEKYITVGTKFWRLHGVKVIDARQRIEFERAA